MVIGTMVGHLARNWGWIVLRGVVAILFGVIAFVMPGITLIALIAAWGTYAIVDGIFALIAAFRMRGAGMPMWPMLLIGLLGLGAGIFTFARPGMTALFLLALIAGWAVFTGLLQVVTAIRLRKEISNEWLLALSGVLSVLFGVAMLARPGAGALAVVWIIGSYAILFGIMLVTVGIRLKGLADRVPKPA